MEIVAALLAWVLCGIIGAIVADQKGRSAAGWAVLCFLLGPLGVVLALVASRDETALEEQALERGDSRKCPQCAEIVKAEARKCRYCGNDLPRLDRSRPDPSIAGTCFLCGTALRKPLPVCPRCGRKDPLMRPALNTEQTPKENPTFSSLRTAAKSEQEGT